MFLLMQKLKRVPRKNRNFEIVTEEWLKYKKNTVKSSTYYNYLYSV